MKKNVLLLLFIFATGYLAKGQDVPQVQKSLITKVTATWCSSCGSWGWNLFEGLVEDNSDKALLIANHYSGDLTNSTAQSIAENFNVSGQPRFIVNNSDQNVTSSGSTAKRADIKMLVDNNFMAMPIANAGLNVTLNDNLLSVNTKTKYFQPSTGAYYIGVYIIENGVINNQASQGMDAVHKNVLRTGMGSDPFGTLIMNGTIGMNMEFDHQFSMMLNPMWNKENLEIATIIWKKEGNDFIFVNTHSTTNLQSTTSLTEITADQLTLKVQPTIAQNHTNLFLDVVTQQDHLQIQVFNQLGQIQQIILNNSVNTGQYQFEVGNNLNPGVYNLVARLKNRILTKRFIIQ